MSSVGRAVVFAMLAGTAIGCADRTPVAPEAVLLPLPEGTALSNATTTMSASTVGALAARVANTVYISAAPGTFPNAISVTVQRAGTGAPVSRPILDGGFDPIAIEASQGERLLVTVHYGSSDDVLYSAIVPPRKRPVIVRTNPPKGSVDVPLNRHVEVVFSEPIDASRLDAAVLTVSAADGPVSGTLQASASGFIVTFTPTSALAPNTVHTVVVGVVHDLDGEQLEAPLTTTFTTAASSVGAIVARVTTTGGIDADGYQVSLDDGQAIPIGANASHTFTNVTPGKRDVSLRGVAAHCTVDAADLRDIPVVAGKSVIVDFAVSCASVVGTRMTTRTTGSHLDPDGYLLSIDGGAPQRIGNNESTSLALDNGEHSVTLTDVASNCALDPVWWGGNVEQRTIFVPVSWSGMTEFVVKCGPPTAALTVRVTTTGSRQDADGYSIVFDGRPPQLVSANFVQVFSSIAPGAHIIAITGIHEDCIVMGSQLVFVTVVPGNANTVAFNLVCESAAAPAGTLAFVSSRDGNEEIYLGSSDGSGLKRLTNNSARDFSPAWSPDGKRIAFLSERTGWPELFLMNADGSNLEQCTSANDYRDSGISWSPDGKRIAVTAVQGGSLGIVTVEADRCSESMQPLLNYPGWDRSPAWNRHDRVAFVSDYAAYDFVADVYVMNSNGSNVVKIKSSFFSPTEWYYNPAWSSDGARLVIGACMELWENCDAGRLLVLDATGATRETFGAAGLSADWSPGGEALAFVSRKCGTGCQSSIRYVLTDGTGRSGLMFSNAHSPSWKPN